MKHSGWEKRAYRQSQMFLLKILGISLHFFALLFAFPQVASTSDMEKTDCISGISGIITDASSGYLQTHKSLPYWRYSKRLKGIQKSRDIVQNTIEEISHNPFIEGKPVEVSVRNDEFNLKGTINNPTEQVEATIDSFQGSTQEVRKYPRVRDSPVLTHKKCNDNSL